MRRASAIGWTGRSCARRGCARGVYLLRTNRAKDDPAKLWEYYIRLVEVEQEFKTLKGDLAIRPVYHQLERRIEAHIFLAFSLHATLRQRLRALAPGLMPRAVMDSFAGMQMIDVQIPTTDGREMLLTRHTEPDNDLRLLLERSRLTLPEQPPPRISTATARAATPM